MKPEDQNTTPESSPEPTTSPAPGSTAEYLAKCLIVERGARPGVPPEAEALAEASDLILSTTDGFSFQILCLIDRESDPDRRFSLPLEKVIEIGRACLKYSGKINFNRLPVQVQIYEVGNQPLSEEDRKRLFALRKMNGFGKVVVSAWHLDSSTGTVWTNMRFGGLFAGRRYLEKLLREPRKSDEEIRKERPGPLGTDARPVVTFLLVGALVALFLAELLFPLLPAEGLASPHILTLVGLGGAAHDLILERGEWYRLLTAAFLHADFLHLLLNGIFVVLAGLFLESLLGRAWLFALFLAGALCGSLAGLALNPENIVSVGASGGLMGLLTAALVSSFRLPKGEERTQSQMVLLRVLLPSLIPLATTTRSGQIDYAAHLGGALGGLLLGLLLWKIWPKESPTPRFQKTAAFVSVAGLALVLFGFLKVYQSYPVYAEEARVIEQMALLIPDEELPVLGSSEEEAFRRAESWVTNYPRDPRGHFLMGLKRQKEGDLAGAEASFKRALFEEEILRTAFPALEAQIQAVFSELLLQQGRREEAAKVARPLCTKKESAASAWAREVGLCGSP